ncbi:MAG: DUF2971 domain-containing protein [Kiritimatiellia bacterium]|jgi:hypothetical protein
MPIPNILYHYCRNESLIHIVNGKILFLTSVTGANDYEETRRARPYIIERLKLHSIGAKNTWMNRLLELFDINDRIPFVLCFSENGDQLSQWRGYADDGQGVSIGFFMPSLSLPQRLPLSYASPEQAIGIDKVIYDEGIQKGIVDRLVDEYVKAVAVNPSTMDNRAIETILQLRQFSLIFKNPGFIEENEWRIIHTPMPYSSPGEPMKLMGAIGNRTSRIIKNSIVTSIPLKLNWANGQEPIAEVFLGPKNKTHPFDLVNLFHENGLNNVEFKRSKTTYR